MSTVTHAPPPPVRAPSGAFITVGAGGKVWRSSDPSGGFAVDTLPDLAVFAGRPEGERWRVVWLTDPGREHFKLPKTRREPLKIGRLAVRCARWEPGSPFVGVDDPGELYWDLWRLEAALGGVPWYSSGAVTSDVLLRILHQPPRGRPIERTTLPPPALKQGRGGRPAGRENPIVWHRRPGPGDYGAHVHHYDLNAAYLAAASKLRLPQGEPVELHPDAGAEHPSIYRQPGYWRLELERIWDVGTLPDPVGPRPAKETELWVTTPTVRLLDDYGVGYRVLAGWYWPGTCEALTPWYERLRDARTILEGPPLAAVKQIYKQGIGRLSSELRSRDDDPLYQPAWTHLVIAESRARVWRRLSTLRRHPLAVDVDSVWIEHEAADPLEAAGELGLPIGSKLGEWKPLGTVPAELVAQVLAGPGRGVFRRLDELEGR